MTDREKLIELICDKLQDNDCIAHCNHPPCSQCNAIADHLIANGVTVNEWISVEDRLPTEDGRYLVVQNDSGRIRQNVHRFATNLKKVDKYDFYYKGDMSAGWYDDYDGEYYEVDDITHWMPLPNPPKEVE